MLPVDRACPICDDKENPRSPQYVKKLGDEVACRSVSPVDVLDKDSDRASTSSLGQHVGNTVEEAVDVTSERRAGNSRFGQLRQQPGEVITVSPDEVVCLVEVVEQDRPENGDDGTERKRSIGELDAVANVCAPPCIVEGRETPGDERRLSNSSLTRCEQHLCAGFDNAFSNVAESRQLIGPTDEGTSPCQIRQLGICHSPIVAESRAR